MDVALDKAIKEIIGPVIQRSVTIATQTTKELVIKVNAVDYFLACPFSFAICLRCEPLSVTKFSNMLPFLPCRIYQWNLMIVPYLALHI